jgi:YegS/Rv2252/BmrU family lipid kinase
VITFIINPISGGVSPDAARARAELASAIVDRHGDPAEVFVTERSGHARELTKAAVARGTRLVMAWGGDGTINEIASTLAFGEVPLGIVPAGSGNGLARQLAINPAPHEAIRHAIAAEPRPIDVGEIDGRLFVNVAGIGFDAHVAWKFDEAKSGRRGLVTYASIAGRALVTYKPATYTIRDRDGEACAPVRAVLITVANSPEFGNGAIIAPGAKLDDGLLDLVVMEERSRLNTIVQLPRLFRGTVDRAPGCSIRRLARATIESDQPMLYHVDGEPASGGTSLRVRVHPGALHVAV